MGFDLADTPAGTLLVCDECGVFVAWAGQQQHADHHDQLRQLAIETRQIAARQAAMQGRISG
jgi:hypothetical protein